MGKAEVSAWRGGMARALPYLADAAFLLWLLTETAFEHTMASRLCLLLFAGVIGLWMLVEKKAFFGFFIPWYVLMLVWCALVTFTCATSRSASMGILATMCLNLVFLFMVYQYALLRRDFDRLFLAFMLGVALLSVITVIRCWPLDIVNSRLGMARDGVGELTIYINPNWIGMMAAFAFGMALSRLWRKDDVKWAYLPAVLFFVAIVLLTKSIKAYGIVYAMTLTVFLLRYPKWWWLKLIAIVAFCVWFFTSVLDGFNFIDDIFFRRLRYTYLNLFQGGTYDTSLDARGSLASVGLRAFLLRPLTGYGPGGFGFLEGSMESYSHNNYIELMVSGGVPLLLIYYAPQAIAIVRAFRHRPMSNAVRVLLPFALLHMVMDYAMVSYVDRTALIWPVLLMAAVRLEQNVLNDGARGYLNVTNPCRLVAWCSVKGRLQWVPDRLYLRMLYRGCLNKKLHLNPPVTMNEKLQWLKLNDHNPLYHTLADKAAVRAYVAERAGEDVLIAQLGLWDDPMQIDFSALPDRFVLKCTHDSGGVRVCADKQSFDAAEAVAFLQKRMKTSYYPAGREWAYKGLTPGVMAEAFIGAPDGTPPDDYKFFCFHGRAEAVCICTDRTAHGAKYYFYDRELKPLRVNDVTAALPDDTPYPKPIGYERMLSVAETLAAGIPHVRVDLYDVEGRVYFGEMTFYDQSGLANDYVGDGDRVMGDFLRIEECQTCV